MTTPPKTLPNTAAPAVPVTAQVLTVTKRNTLSTYFRLKHKEVAVIDFYKGQS